MRVNVYAEEMSGDTAIVSTKAATGRTYHGIRFYLDSTDKLHHTPEDDDRSAVTIWGDLKKLADLFKKMVEAMENEP